MAIARTLETPTGSEVMTSDDCSDDDASSAYSLLPGGVTKKL